MKDKTIYQTKDYSMFKLLPGNREIDERHVRDIMKSMDVATLDKTICVNENLEIIDGQHTFEARKRKNLPIFYVIHPGAGIKETRALNATSKRWTQSDFLKSKAALGDEESQWCLDIQTRYGLTWGFFRDLVGFNAKRIADLCADGGIKSGGPSVEMKTELVKTLDEIVELYSYIKQAYSIDMSGKPAPESKRAAVYLLLSRVVAAENYAVAKPRIIRAFKSQIPLGNFYKRIAGVRGSTGLVEVFAEEYNKHSGKYRVQLVDVGHHKTPLLVFPAGAQS